MENDCIRKIRLRRFVFRPSGTLGEPHEVTAPFLAFIPSWDKCEKRCCDLVNAE